MNRSRALIVRLLLMALLQTWTAAFLPAEVKLHGLFTDNMILQRDMPAAPFRTDDFEQGASKKVGGIAVGKPFVCSHPNGQSKSGVFAGLTDGSLEDSNRTTFATNMATTFPKQVTVDLQGKFTLSAIRVDNSSFGGTKTVEVQVSGDGETFETLGKTEFKNYVPGAYELTGLNAKGVAFVRLVFPDVHETWFQHKANGFIFLRELEVQGEPEK